MAKPSSKSIQQLISDKKLEIAELEDALLTQKYFETMPEYGPTYKYCYATSNMSIPGLEQNVDYWLRAVIRHIGTRSFGHGGEKTNAMLISIPTNLSDKGREEWLNYITGKLRKAATPKKRTSKSVK